MVDGRRRDAWGVTSSVMALIANCHRDPKKKLFTPADFDPHAQRKSKGTPIKYMSIRDMAHAVGAKGVS